LGQLQESCNSHIVGDERVLARRSHPEDSLIGTTVAIGIFHSGLRFANPAQAGKRLRLRESSSPARREVVMQGHEQALTTREKRVAPVGNIPEGRRCAGVEAPFGNWRYGQAVQGGWAWWHTWTGRHVRER